jgi:hypothetical protein
MWWFFAIFSWSVDSFSRKEALEAGDSRISRRCLVDPALIVAMA